MNSTPCDMNRFRNSFQSVFGAIEVVDQSDQDVRALFRGQRAIILPIVPLSFFEGFEFEYEAFHGSLERSPE